MIATLYGWLWKLAWIWASRQDVIIPAWRQGKYAGLEYEG